MALTFGDRKQGPYYCGDWDEPHVRFECDHESYDRDIVMRLYRQVKAGNGVGLCDECGKKKRLADKQKSAEEATIQSVAFAMNEGLRPLTGERAKVELAEKLRAAFFQAFHKEEAALGHSLYTPQDQEEGLAILEAVSSEVKEQTEAQWWIDAPHHDYPSRQVLELCKEALKRLLTIEKRERFARTDCGHRGTKRAVGARQKMFCAKCIEKGAEALIQPERIAPSDVLPELEGTERQIVWAEKIRLSFYAAITEHESMHPETKEKLDKIRNRMKARVKAKYWIESDSRENPKAHLKSLLSPRKS
jgi:hypothetical protein